MDILDVQFFQFYKQYCEIYVYPFAFLGNRFIDVEILRKNIKTFYTISFQFSINFVVDI